jgi:hypothetical protein
VLALKEFFDFERERFTEGLTPNQSELIIFNDKQKEKSGGYDAVIVYWNKFEANTETIVNKLQKRNNRVK